MRKLVREELDRIAAAHRGRLRVRVIVEEARNSASPLHKEFDWSPDKAMRYYLEDQARDLIQRYIKVTTIAGKDHTYRAYVSLGDDRAKGTGYRRMEDVLGEPILRQRLIDEALTELNLVKARYEHLRELAHVWKAIGATKRKKAA